MRKFVVREDQNQELMKSLSKHKPSEKNKSQGSAGQHAGISDKREQAAAQRKEQELITNSPITIAQRQAFDEALGTSNTTINNTGMPHNLKEGLENLSGISLDDVKVHYNSSKPEQLQALAYAQGNNIHLAPGQEKYLPHEAWHVIQQKQGRVQPLAEVNGVPVNDNVGLEKEADAMGRKAITGITTSATPVQKVDTGDETIQRKVGFEMEDGNWQVFVPKGVVDENKEGVKVKSRNIYEENRLKNKTDLDKLKREKGAPVVDDVLDKYGLALPGKKITIYRSKYFKLETDGPYGVESFMDIEFVTKAFEENEKGMSELREALLEIGHIMRVLCKHSGYDLLQGQFITPKVHNLGDVYISGGKEEPSFKIQATQGLLLRDVPAMMEYFGSDVPHETEKQTNERRPARNLMRENGTSGIVSKAIGVSPTIAGNIVRELVEGEVLDQTDDLDSVKGFFSMIVLYIQSLKSVTPDGIKTFIPFMSRYPFNDLFKMIAKPTRKKLKARIFRLEVDLENELAPYYQGFNTLNPLINHIKLSINYTEHANVFNRLKKLDVQDWLHGIIIEDTDYLTSNGMIEYLAGWSEDYEAFEKTYRIFMRGHGVTKNLEQDDEPLAVIENRGIKPVSVYDDDLNMEEATEATTAYLAFITNIKAAGGDHSKIGAFPSLNTLPRKPKKTTNIATDSKCFLTTACMMTLNLPDDCFELVTLRKFRDEFILRTAEGRELIEEYYTIAPVIVTSIQQDTEEEKLWKIIYKIIGNCIKHIQRNRPQVALNMYINMVKGLRERYGV